MCFFSGPRLITAYENAFMRTRKYGPAVGLLNLWRNYKYLLNCRVCCVNVPDMNRARNWNYLHGSETPQKSNEKYEREDLPGLGTDKHAIAQAKSVAKFRLENLRKSLRSCKKAEMYGDVAHLLVDSLRCDAELMFGWAAKRYDERYEKEAKEADHKRAELMRKLARDAAKAKKQNNETATR